MNDYESRLAYLYKQYADGNCTKEERMEFMDLISNSESTDHLNNLIDHSLENDPVEHTISTSRADELFGLITDKTKLKIVGSRSIPRISNIWRAAVIFVLVAGLASWIFQYTRSTNTATFATSYGIIDTLTLPDNSFIILNANSKVKYNKKWSHDEPREVWLEGEGLFHIIHINRGLDVKPYERFIVHVKNATVEVLGTVFNVRERRGKTEIALREGKIRVMFKKSAAPGVVMLPGQILTIDSIYQKPGVTTTKNEDYTKWTERKLELTNATLKEIAAYLEDHYGKRIILADAMLGDRRIGGTFRMDNLEDALFALSKALNLEITENDNTLFITPK